MNEFCKSICEIRNKARWGGFERNSPFVKHSEVAISLLCVGSPLFVYLIRPLHMAQCSCLVCLSCFLLIQSTLSRQIIPNETSRILSGATNLDQKLSTSTLTNQRRSLFCNILFFYVYYFYLTGLYTYGKINTSKYTRFFLSCVV